MQAQNVMYLFFISLFFIGCSSNNKPTDRSLAEKLNPATYESLVLAGPVPVAYKENPIRRKISGHIFCGDGITQTPANKASISVLEDNTILSGSNSDSSGFYEFTADVKKGKKYFIKSESKCGHSNDEITWPDAASMKKDIFLRK